MILRPRAVVLDGRLETGYEVEVEGNQVVKIRAGSGKPDDYVLSPAFVNAHSHLEYRGMLGRLHSMEYWPWIRELTRQKAEQDPEDVRCDCMIAAGENRRSGVALIAEHSDRPFAGEALTAAGLEGIIYQEVITFAEHQNPSRKLAAVEDRAEEQRRYFSGAVRTSPHASYTVDPKTLKHWGNQHHHADPFPAFSIHIGESTHERVFFESHSGPIADLYRTFGVEIPFERKPWIEYLDELGLLAPGAQFVHVCDVTDRELDRIAEQAVSVAHCPRSNRELACPHAPVLRMLDRGIRVGIGLDSPASSGPIDMLSEMQAARDASMALVEPIPAGIIWDMATTGGALSLGIQDWKIDEDLSTPLIAIQLRQRDPTFETLLYSMPSDVTLPVISQT
ncbi:MAG: 5'-deoxyadenosine deaminase [Fimbriimonadaceae bacterium]|nr:5'-deoxyadenosine deaminase [Fimbriimonadaceae bacterium]